jgi:hypothetical protein
VIPNNTIEIQVDGDVHQALEVLVDALTEYWQNRRDQDNLELAEVANSMIEVLRPEYLRIMSDRKSKSRKPVNLRSTRTIRKKT